jgi:RimJ/RimL family protein N-acetyltransferase
MNICYKEFRDEIDILVEFLKADTWEYHGNSSPSEEEIKRGYNNGVYTGEYCKTFWILLNEDVRVGMIRIFDLEDSTPLFDIRILSNYRGMGIGQHTIKWVTNYIFNTYEDKDRIEGYTRQDNYGMRTVFHRCGYMKEAHHRRAWKDKYGNFYDAIGYGILRGGWKENKRTAIDWDDFKY